MCRLRASTPWGEKIQATPTKKDVGTSKGFFSKFPMNTPVVFIRESPRVISTYQERQ